MRGRWTSAVGLLALVLAACGPAATATPQSVATPTRAVSATATPVASTPSPATATPVAKATATPATTSSGGPKSGGVFVSPQREDPPSWDPVVTQLEPGGDTTSLVLGRWFEAYPDPPQGCKTGAYPLVVQEWKWQDDRTLRMTLRQGIRFHNKPPVNGRELVAEDLAFSFDRYRTFYYYTSLTARVEKAAAEGKYSLELKLKEPFGGIFEELFAASWAPFVMAKEAGGPEGKLWEQPEKSWIGVGPFVFERWLSGVKWSTVRNPNYFRQPYPYLDRVEFVVMPEASTRMAAMRAGKLTAIRGLHEAGITELMKQVPALQVIRCPGLSVTGPGLVYMDNSAPPFNDVRVRRAVAMAIDQKKIIDTLYEGKADWGRPLAAVSPYSLAPQDYPPEARQYLEYHPDRARRLLAEAGYPKGLDTVVHFTPRYAPPSVWVAEAVVGMLADVGIRARLNLMEYAQYTSTVFRNKYPKGEMAFNPASTATPEASHALRPQWSGSGEVNRSRVNDPEYDAVYLKMVTETNEAKRKELVHQLQVMHADRMYKVMLPMPDGTLVVQPGGRDFLWNGVTSAYTLGMERFWWAK